MRTTDWPRPPIRPEHLPLIRGLLSPEDYEALLKRMEADPARPAGSMARQLSWVFGDRSRSQEAALR